VDLFVDEHEATGCDELWETSFAVESRAGADGELVDFEAVDLCVTMERGTAGVGDKTSMLKGVCWRKASDEKLGVDLNLCQQLSGMV